MASQAASAPNTKRLDAASTTLPRGSVSSYNMSSLSQHELVQRKLRCYFRTKQRQATPSILQQTTTLTNDFDNVGDEDLNCAASIAVLSIPVFVPGWRKLRYPSCNGEAVSNKKTPMSPQELRASFMSRPSLESLLVLDAEEQERLTRNSSNSDSGKRAVRSFSWKDGLGCQWNILLFPLGHIDPTYMSMFLEKNTICLDRDVVVEFCLHPLSAHASLSSSNVVSSPPTLPVAALAQPPLDLLRVCPPDQNDRCPAHELGGPIELSIEFSYRFPAQTTSTSNSKQQQEKEPRHAQSYGRSDAFKQADVLRNYITDDGCLVCSVYIFDKPLSFASVTNSSSVMTMSTFGRLPRLQRPPGMLEAQRQQGVLTNIDFLKYDDSLNGLSFKSIQSEAKEEDSEKLLENGTKHTQMLTPPSKEDDNLQILLPQDGFSTVYAGLLNQGATCYMNVLLQVWFHIPVFCDKVINLPLLNDAHKYACFGETDISVESVTLGGDIPSGRCNGNNNVLVQSEKIANDDGKENDLDDERRKTPARLPTLAEGKVGQALQSIFEKLLLSSTRCNTATISKNRVVTTSALTAAFGWDSASLLRQHDVQELSRVLLDKLESIFQYQHQLDRRQDTPTNTAAIADEVTDSDPGSKPLLPYLFEGKLQSCIECTSVPYSSTKIENFLDIQLQVKGCPSLYISLRQFTHEDDLTGDNQYDTSDGGFGKQNARKGVKMHTLPPVLNIHLKRFEFDLRTIGGMIKVHDRFEFPLVINMKEFMVKDKTGDGTNMSEGKALWYHLHSIVTHSGDVDGGHYMAFIRPKLSSYRVVDDEHLENCGSDDNLSREWYMFDDDIVARVDEANMLETAYGGPLQTLQNVPNKSPGAVVSKTRSNALNARASRLLKRPRREGNSSSVRTGDKASDYRRSSTMSAYMLSYVRESDLEWVLRRDEHQSNGDIGAP